MPPSIDDRSIRHLAHLSRLRLSDAELAAFGPQLEAIVSYVRQLSEVDTRDVEPTAHPLPVRNIFREDVPGEPLGAERALANAPEKEFPFFKVPRVLDQVDA